jgi:KDO2-lipid IV(A) lauroyltransferase
MAVFALLPRALALRLGEALAAAMYRVAARLRKVGLRNLELAFPSMPVAEREALLREEFRSLGRQLAEFPRMPRLDREAAETLIRYEGLEHYLAAKAKGRGVFVLTAHLGLWELSSFYHSLMGYPMSMVIRRLDNPLLDDLVNGIRSMHGNRVLPKDDFARGLLTAMHRGETVGILMDTNMTPPQGVFVPFFGIEACTGSGLARVALRTGAAVLPGFLLWEASERRYVLHFGEELTLVRTGDAEKDVIANTALFTATLESWIRRYPGQWLWVHRRWKTRPEGEAKLYV